jgi:hypothetical protein
MALTTPYPAELQRLARKVVSASDIALAERYIHAAEFRAVLENAPAGVFTQEVWSAWHRRFGILPIPPLPRRRFPDGTLGPEAGDFFGR